VTAASRKDEAATQGQGRTPEGPNCPPQDRVHTLVHGVEVSRAALEAQGTQSVAR